MRVLIAGGGTGGHVFPALAVAEALSASPYQAEVLFVGTEGGFEARAVPAAGFPIEYVRVAGLKRVSLGARLRGLSLLPQAFGSSWSILSRFKPDVVLGVGGYASGPLVACAWLRRIPTAVCEQNSIPGFTNRVLGRVADAVLGSFEVSERYFDSSRFRVVGNPVRAALAAVERTRWSGGLHIRVLVLGGSQGARPLNERLPAGMARVVQQGIEPEIRHQAGRHEVDSVAAAYRGLGLDAEVTPFIDDMAAAYGWADIVVARAGATTCAELTAVGVPSILIPFPQAADDHQTVNAKVLADAGAAMLLPQAELTAEAVADRLAGVVDEGGLVLEEMVDAARAIGRPDAARQVADVLARLSRGGAV